jgi:hypothetical protein
MNKINGINIIVCPLKQSKIKVHSQDPLNCFFYKLRNVNKKFKNVFFL